MLEPKTTEDMQSNESRAEKTPSGQVQQATKRDIQLRPILPVDISVHNLGLQLDLRRTGLARIASVVRRNPPLSQDACFKTILNNVNASMPAGSITAIIGASGSGKTSFLNVLSRRMHDSRLEETGDILYNGSPDITTVRSAYVMQEDVLLPTLTVRETLYYAAELRLPASTTAEERRAVVEDVILELGLKECANTRIGSESRKGCSGGEKRRTSLGVQLLVNPSVLFLDEVTTGLDATSAYQLVRALRKLAKRGRNIVITIHQPRSEIWHLFDRFVLLAEGSLVFSGPPTSCRSHFDDRGFPFPQFVNPAEHLIDLAAIDYRSPELETTSRARVEELKRAWREVSAHGQSHHSHTYAPAGDLQISQQKAGFMRQVKVQTARTFRTTWRDPLGAVGCMLECLSMAIITGWMFLNLDGSQSGIRSREGALYIAIALQNYLILLFETYRLTLEIGVFDRERADRVVDVVSFLISRRLARCLLEDLPIPFIFSVIFYFMAGFRQDAGQFFIFFGISLLSHYTAVTFAMLTVAISRDFAGASLIANLNFTLQSLCSGFFIQSNQIPVYVRWLKWTAYVWYANGAVITNEFVGNSGNSAGYLYDCPYPGGVSNPACAPWTGRFVVALLGYPQDNWIWRPALALIGFTCVYSIVSGLIFSFFKVEMRIARPRTPKQDLYLAQGNIPVHSLDQTRPLTVTLDNYGLEIEKRGLFGQKVRTIPILRPLNVEFKPGTLNVIMGVSGGGKTSLLNLMARRLSNTYTTRYKPSGTMLFGGSVPSNDIVRSITSYVCQSDAGLLPNLTVRETLKFAAQLRLPVWMSTADKLKRADEIMLKLGLRDCADRLVGNHQVKGISGGEKRRVSIAIQILTQPKILYLDEPTSGLDAFTASSIIAMLQSLAREGRTIILTIHQSRSDMFRHFGYVLLLARGGYPVFAGPGHDMLPYLSTLGHSCPDNTNPTDFALDLVSVDFQSPSEEAATREKVQFLTTAWTQQSSQTIKSVSDQSPVATLPATLGAYRRERVSILVATRLVLHRSTISLFRSQSAIMARTSQVFSFAILLTLFFAPLQRNFPGVQSYVGFLQEILAVYFIGMLQNVAVYPEEKSVFDNENDDGVYGVEPFIISYTILELPFEIIVSALFGVLATFASGLPRTGPIFGLTTFACFSLVNCGESIGIIFNTMFRSTGFAVSLISVVLSLGLVMSGVVSTNIPRFLDAFNHISPSKWSTAALAAYTLRGVTFTCEDYEKVDGRCPIETGEDVLALYNLNKEGDLPILWLAIVVIGYRLLAYGCLKIVKGEWSVKKAMRRDRERSGTVATPPTNTNNGQ